MEQKYQLLISQLITQNSLRKITYSAFGTMTIEAKNDLICEKFLINESSRHLTILYEYEEFRIGGLNKLNWSFDTNFDQKSMAEAIYKDIDKLGWQLVDEEMADKRSKIRTKQSKGAKIFLIIAKYSKSFSNILPNTSVNDLSNSRYTLLEAHIFLYAVFSHIGADTLKSYGKNKEQELYSDLNANFNILFNETIENRAKWNLQSQGYGSKGREDWEYFYDKVAFYFRCFDYLNLKAICYGIFLKQMKRVNYSLCNDKLVIDEDITLNPILFDKFNLAITQNLHKFSDEIKAVMLF
ncbi:MAG: hypothetical protein NTX61_05590 [Bacteroidetes bacterium]|nr:hypothetical protein [Bacteroidota bacterium]